MAAAVVQREMAKARATKKASPGKRSGPGRPAWKADAESRKRVCRLVSVGLTHTAIALRLGITLPTLRKHCPKELLDGADLARAELFEMMFGAADKGNVAAMKALREIQAAAGARDSILRDEDEVPAPAPVEKLGKKEMQLREAAKAGADSPWGNDLNPNTSTAQ